MFLIVVEFISTGTVYHQNDENESRGFALQSRDRITWKKNSVVHGDDFSG